MLLCCAAVLLMLLTFFILMLLTMQGAIEAFFSRAGVVKTTLFQHVRVPNPALRPLIVSRAESVSSAARIEKHGFEHTTISDVLSAKAIINGLPSTELSNEDKALCDRAQALISSIHHYVLVLDEREETVNGKQQKVYYSVLVEGGDKLDECFITCLVYVQPRNKLCHHWPSNFGKLFEGTLPLWSS
ncbi:hypothetical protein LINPERPRIM_LOCUS42753 [Linum perenne]